MWSYVSAISGTGAWLRQGCQTSYSAGQASCSSASGSLNCLRTLAPAANVMRRSECRRSLPDFEQEVQPDPWRMETPRAAHEPRPMNMKEMQSIEGVAPNPRGFFRRIDEPGWKPRLFDPRPPLRLGGITR